MENKNLGFVWPLILVIAIVLAGSGYVFYKSKETPVTPDRIEADSQSALTAYQTMEAEMDAALALEGDEFLTVWKKHASKNYYEKGIVPFESKLKGMSPEQRELTIELLKGLLQSQAGLEFSQARTEIEGGTATLYLPINKDSVDRENAPDLPDVLKVVLVQENNVWKLESEE